MSNYTRRVPPQQYYAVPQTIPQSPRAAGPSRQSSQNPSYSTTTIGQPNVSNLSYTSRPDRDETTHRVATGQIGGGYGPYSVRVFTSSSLVRSRQALCILTLRIGSIILTSMPVNTLPLASAMPLVAHHPRCLLSRRERRRVLLL